MTTKKLYGILDKKVGFDGTPFLMPNRAVAIRAFVEECKKTDTSLYKYPEDYALVELGEFEIETGKIKANIETVAEAADFVIKKEEE